MEFAVSLKNDFGFVTNMHLTCTNVDSEKIKRTLDYARSVGISNILALRGDEPSCYDKWEVASGGFSSALDLIKFMRQQHGSFFCISVAGYPEGHPDKIKLIAGGRSKLSEEEEHRAHYRTNDDGSESVFVCSDDDYSEEIDYLKAKIDAGADFVITQMIFDAITYQEFVKACRKKGITCPVIPGIMCLNTYAGFKKMVASCKSHVPDSFTNQIESIKDDPRAVKKFSVEFGAEISRALAISGAPGLHYFTLNVESVVMGILNAFGGDHDASDAATIAEA